jgi:hypothetical protein
MLPAPGKTAQALLALALAVGLMINGIIPQRSSRDRNRVAQRHGGQIWNAKIMSC